MNKKQRKQLSQIQIRYSYTNDLLVAMLDESEGMWYANDDKILFSNCAEGVSIVKGAYGALCIEHSSTPEIKVPINDPELIALIDEIRPKPKKVAKKSEKKKATSKKKEYTYMDVFKRVYDFMSHNTGFAPEDIESEDDEVDICLDDDGNEHTTWTNAKAFVGGDENEESIFEVIADLDMKYDKLASRWDAEFCNSCRILGKVNVKDTSPAGIMKALDKAGL